MPLERSRLKDSFFYKLLERERRKLEEYFYSTTILVTDQAFQILCIRRLWNKTSVVWFERENFRSEISEARFDQIYQVFADAVEHGHWRGYFLQVIWESGKILHKFERYPRASRENIAKSLALKLSDMFALNHRRLKYAITFLPKLLPGEVDVMVHGVLKNELEQLMILKDCMQEPFKIGKVTPFLPPVIASYINSPNYDEDRSTIFVVALENRMILLTFSGPRLVSMISEVRSFFDSDGAFDQFEWAYFLKGKFRSLLFDSLGRDFPMKLEISQAVFLTEREFFDAACKELTRQYSINGIFYQVKEERVDEPEFFDTPEKIMQLEFAQLKFSDAISDSNFVAPDVESFEGSLMGKIVQGHMLATILVLMVLGNLYMGVLHGQAERNLSTAVSLIQKEKEELAQTERIYDDIKVLKKKMTRIRGIISSQIHPTYWLKVIETYLPESTVITNVKVKKGVLEVEGDSVTQRDVIAFTRGMSKEKGIQEMNLEYVNLKSKGGFNFRVVFYWLEQSLAGTQAKS